MTLLSGQAVISSSKIEDVPVTIKDIGRMVVYQKAYGSEKRYGVITSVAQGRVWVRLEASDGSKVFPESSLKWRWV